MEKKTLFIVLPLWLSACAMSPHATPPVDPSHRQQLADAGAQIAEALTQLAVVEQAAHRLHAQTFVTADAAPPELRTRVAVDYQGDLKPFVYQLAQVAGYAVKTYGRSSVLTPINVQAEDRALGELLADAGYQASWRCQLVVDPSRRLVEILYDNRRPASAARDRRRG
ncbi:MAG: DotD/TraH family lipoprotein [Candidatus Competibacter sp.]